MHLPYWIKKYLNPSEVEQLTAEVALAEQTTNAEIIPMIVRSSSSVDKKIALIGLTLLVSGFYYYNIWLLIGAVMCYFIHRNKVKIQVEDRAIKEFEYSGITATKAKTGVLIFLSLKEKKIMILADEGISDFVNKENWTAITDQLAEKIKKGSLASGLSDAIKQVAIVCAKVAPPITNEINEISDKVIIKE